jgi:hypothetical protein
MNARTPDRTRYPQPPYAIGSTSTAAAPLISSIGRYCLGRPNGPISTATSPASVTTLMEDNANATREMAIMRTTQLGSITTATMTGMTPMAASQPFDADPDHDSSGVAADGIGASTVTPSDPPADNQPTRPASTPATTITAIDAIDIGSAPSHPTASGFANTTCTFTAATGPRMK